jgi:hypothetical protein
MIIRTLRPCLIQGRNVAAGFVLDLGEADAKAALAAGDAAEEVAAPAQRVPQPSPYAPAAEPAADPKPHGPARLRATQE